MKPNERLLLAIRAKGVTQTKAAKIMCIRPDNLSRIIRGRMNPMATEKAEIARHFGVPVEAWGAK